MELQFLIKGKLVMTRTYYNKKSLKKAYKFYIERYFYYPDITFKMTTK